MSIYIGANIVPERPKELARYTIRELLILGLTLPIRFCPINKFGSEALGLEIISLERMRESLLQYEGEQMRQWHIAQQQARKRLAEAARAKAKREERDGVKGASNHEAHAGDLDGEGDRTLADDIGPCLGSRTVARFETFRRPNRQDSLHFQIPSSHGGAPVNINIGLSLDYSPIPASVASVHQSATIGNPSPSRYPWNNKPQQSANLSTLLKDAPVVSKPSASHEPSTMNPTHSQQTATTPPTQTTVPDITPGSRGGDTPNSMAVERATEPSLRSYSPTSSIRASSELDFAESSSQFPLDTPSPNHRSSHDVPSRESCPPTSSPRADSIATLVSGDSPAKNETHEGNGSGDGYVVISSTTSESATGAASRIDLIPAASSMKTGLGRSTSSIVSGKALLGKGKIDPKAQDEFIAFMLAKK